MDLVGKSCPCISGYICDEVRDLCIPESEAEAGVDSTVDSNVDAVLTTDAEVNEQPVALVHDEQAYQACLTAEDSYPIISGTHGDNLCEQFLSKRSSIPRQSS
ncbi:MAG: hypothetical protein IPJ88_02930 [Myxococcales bacterium]|nr:MAG: hypothetical protein IPJ88_02930 [Myxococcales bacterium]